MFSRSDPLLYFVTPAIGDSIETWEYMVREALEGGVRMVQVRDKNNAAHKVIEAVKKIQPALKRTGVPLLINDRIDIACAVQADGIHLGQSDLTVSEARSLLGRDAIIGLSVETIDQAIEAENESVTYLAASPVFVTSTKLDCSTPWGAEGLKQLCSISSHAIVAIGGIGLENVEIVLECGAAGVAIVSAIAKALHPRAAAQEILSKMRRYTAR